RVDPDERPLLQRQMARPDRPRGQLAEVRVVTDEDGPLRLAGVEQDRLDRDGVEAAREALVDRDLEVERLGDELGGLAGPELGRGDDRVGLEPDLREELPEPSRLLLALARERPRLVRAGP